LRWTICLHAATMSGMGTDADSPYDLLWREYSRVFQEFDDLTLARWLAQTLGQMEGKVWRHSHPLLVAYRLAAQVGHDQQIWHKRLAHAPSAYQDSPCCRAPMLPLLTREVAEAGLICEHCGETLVPFEEISEGIRAELGEWAAKYAPVHAVAHWDDRQRKGVANYDRAYENAADEAEVLLGQAGSQLAHKLLDSFAAVVWEDQDDCLEVRPEDVRV
jgi:hypothetical protein